MNQSDARRLLLLHGACRLIDRARLGKDVERSPQREANHAGSDGAVALSVDENEGAGAAVVGIWVNGYRRHGRDVAEGNLVELERARCEMLEGIDVDLVLDRGDVSAGPRRADAHQVGAAGQKRLLSKPDDVSCKRIGDLWARARLDEKVPACHVDFLGESDRHGIPGARLVEIPVSRYDASDRAALAGRRDEHLAAFAARPAAMVPENPRKSWLGRSTSCTGKRNGCSPAPVTSALSR